MEELSRIAIAYYQASSENVQKLAQDFFGAMDHDGDGNIDKKEFLEFMRDEGYAQMTNPSFVNQLDLDGNGTFDFDEVMTVYYIVKSGRPFCDWCKKFITSTYFTCVGCLEDPLGGSSFYLCPYCYINKKCVHTHNDLSRFIDNYLLLQAMIKSKLSELKSPEARSTPDETSNMVQCHQPVPSMTQNQYSYFYPPPYPVQYPVAPNQYPYPPAPNYQYPYPAGQHLVPQREQWKIALEALNNAHNIRVDGSTLCSIL